MVLNRVTNVGSAEREDTGLTNVEAGAGETTEETEEVHHVMKTGEEGVQDVMRTAGSITHLEGHIAMLKSVQGIEKELSIQGNVLGHHQGNDIPTTTVKSADKAAPVQVLEKVGHANSRKDFVSTAVRRVILE